MNGNERKARRFIVIVLDSVGIGALPDADEYGDAGSNTLANTAVAVGGLALPNMQQLGLGNISPIRGVPPSDDPGAAYGRMAEVSAGKDTTTGHWEIAGVVLRKPFPVYPDGFPQDLIAEFERRIGRKTLGNKPASGTKIIEELGEQHLETGFPIVYTSADSVFQIATHEDVIPPEKLYEICITARKLLTGDHAVGRVIARPFAGEPGAFYRTERRRDFSLEPPEPTLLDILSESGFGVYGVGKIEDIFAGRGLTDSIHARTNSETIDSVVRLVTRESKPGLIFANCVEFDMVYGHRNDPVGYARALQEVDARLPEILNSMREDDVLVITADHGCDPTTSSTDHSREYVPLLVAGERVRAGVNLGTRPSFADLGATIAETLGVRGLRHGRSFDRMLFETVNAQVR